MNNTNWSAARTGFALCSVWVMTLAGCTTYVAGPAPRTVYVPPPPVPPPVVVAPMEPPVVVIHTEADFYEPLSAHGQWVVVGAYGRCWRPARVEADWRPYSNGHWRRTDAGWYWASDEPWGWATYHYGRWDWNVQFGWIWVPHTQWAPAWVSWRGGAGYVGWAPLAPSVRIGISGVAEIREPAFASRSFVFVEERRLLEPVRPKTVIVNNTTIINQTVNITKIQEVNKTVINEGPRPEAIERASGRKVQPVPVHELRRNDEAVVVTRQRNAPATVEKRLEPPSRTAPDPGEPKPVRPRETRQVESPAGATRSPPPPAAPGRIREAQEPKPSAVPAQPQAGRPAKPEIERPTPARRPLPPPPEKQAEKQLKSSKENPATSRQSEANKKKKELRKKGEEQETSPQPPAAPSRRPQ